MLDTKVLMMILSIGYLAMAIYLIIMNILAFGILFILVSIYMIIIRFTYDCNKVKKNAIILLLIGILTMLFSIELGYSMFVMVLLCIVQEKEGQSNI